MNTLNNMFLIVQLNRIQQWFSSQRAGQRNTASMLLFTVCVCVCDQTSVSDEWCHPVVAGAGTPGRFGRRSLSLITNQTELCVTRDGRHTNTQNDRLLREVWSVWFAQQAAEAGGDTNLQHTLTDDRGIKWMLAVGFRCRMSWTKCPTVKGEAAVCSRWFLLIRTTVTFPSPDLNPNRAVYVL